MVTPFRDSYMTHKFYILKIQGQLQRALEFKHSVLIEGLDNSSHNVRIISPNADARLDLLQFILQIEDLTNHANDHPDTKGTGAKLSRLLKGRVLSEKKNRPENFKSART